MNAVKNGGEIKMMKMLRHFEQNHPTKVYEDNFGKNCKEVPFSMCDELGNLVPMKKCSKKTSSMSRQIGIGPSLFLMSSKSFAILFIILTIVCIPFYVMLGQVGTIPWAVRSKFVDMFGDESDDEEIFEGRQQNIFERISLGVISQSNVACGSSNYDGIINAYIRNNTDYYKGNSTIPIQC